MINVWLILIIIFFFGGGGWTSTILERGLCSRPSGIPPDVYVPIIHILCVLYYYNLIVGRWVVKICIRYARAQYNYIQLYAIIWYINIIILLIIIIPYTCELFTRYCACNVNANHAKLFWKCIRIHFTTK